MNNILSTAYTTLLAQISARMPAPQPGYREFSREAIEVVAGRIVSAARRGEVRTLEDCGSMLDWMA